MTNQSTLTAVVIFLAAYLVYTEVYKRLSVYISKLRTRSAQHRENIEKMVVSMDVLAQALNKLSSNDADANKLLAGTIKACESIAQCTVDLREEIKNFGKMVGNTESNSTYPSDNLSHPLSDEEANKTGVFIEAILRGIPVKQAEQEAADAEEKKILYSAISMGPEE